MEVIRGVRNLEKSISCALTIGNFDGVHLGHQRLVAKVLELAKKHQVKSAVMTFNPHPVQVLYPERELKRLFPFEDQIEQLGKLGIDYLIIEPFSRDFSALKPAEFLNQWILKPLHPRAMVVGYDFTFGANKSGDIDFLKEQSSSAGFELHIVDAHKEDQIVVSSSQIRKVLGQGDVEQAQSLLGRRFYLSGNVVKGEGRGKSIGIPTANVEGHWRTLPTKGVYSVLLVDKGVEYHGVCNIGTKPTFHGDSSEAPVVEVHIFDFAEDIYGHNVSVEFVSRIRSEQKFSSAEELVKQINKDIVQAKEDLKKI